MRKAISFFLVLMLTFNSMTPVCAADETSASEAEIVLSPIENP